MLPGRLSGVPRVYAYTQQEAPRGSECHFPECLFERHSIYPIPPPHPQHSRKQGSSPGRKPLARTPRTGWSPYRAWNTARSSSSPSYEMMYDLQ